MWNGGGGDEDDASSLNGGAVVGNGGGNGGGGGGVEHPWTGDDFIPCFGDRDCKARRPILGDLTVGETLFD